MRRRFAVLTLCLALPCSAQLKTRDSDLPRLQRRERPSEEARKAELPPGFEHMVDEDEDVLVDPTEYAFNPIQAKKELKIGDFYAKRGNHRAAVGRYMEALKWNPSYGEAFWKLGRSREEMNQSAEALEAYRKFVKVEPESKKARELRKRIAALEKQITSLPKAAAEQDAPAR